MGRFKKSKATRTVLLTDDVKYLAENTQFNKENIMEWHQVRLYYLSQTEKLLNGNYIERYEGLGYLLFIY